MPTVTLRGRDLRLTLAAGAAMSGALEVAMTHVHSRSSPRCHALFGCGEGGPVVRGGDDLAEHLLDRGARDRLPRMGVSAAALDGVLTARGRERPAALRTTGVLGAVAAAGPLFSAACASPQAAGSAASSGGGPAGALPARLAARREDLHR